MSTSPEPRPPTEDGGQPSPGPGRTPAPGRYLWRITDHRPLTTALFCLLPWAAVWLGLYQFKSGWVAFLCYHSLCLVGWLVLRFPRLPKEERVSPMRRRILVLIVVLANIATAGLYILIGSKLLDKPHVLDQMRQSGLAPATYFYLFPYFTLVNPVAEELFWRAGIYVRLRPLFPHWAWAAGISSFFFGAWHWLVVRQFVAPPIALLATVAIAGIGFLLTVVYERHRRIIYPVTLHALAGDLPLLLVLYLVGR